MDLIKTERVIPDPSTSNVIGDIRVNPMKSCWIVGHGIAGLFGLIFFAQVSAFVVFLTLSALTICAGHSVGMHRLLIHRSFQTPRIVEYVLVYLGTLVGMAGPFGMIKAHDLRDWHQRQLICPPHPAHNAGFWTDAYWQLCCDYRLEYPPRFEIGPKVDKDRFYIWLEKYWMLQQLPIAVVMFYFGGLAWVLWGCSLRIFVSLYGHWLIGHFAHRRGSQDWIVEGLPVQGYNLPWLSLVTFGENWHGNHHAFPHSARLGLGGWQSDPGYLFILVLSRCGLAQNIQQPESEPPRAGLVKVTSTSGRI